MGQPRHAAADRAAVWYKGHGRIEGKRRNGHAITSLGPDRATAADLLALARAHWEIENRPHGVHDVTLREDACQVRSGQAPQVLAACRNAAVPTLLRRLGAPTVERIEPF